MKTPKRLLAILSLLVACLTVAIPISQAQVIAPCFQIVSSPDAGYENYLFGAAASGSKAWAVGYWNYGTGFDIDHTLVEYYDGSNPASWQVQTSANIANTDNHLYAVSMVDASHGWAVGDYNNGVARSTLIERWNGVEWKIVPSPNPTSDNTLTGVSAVSDNVAWAVGDYGGGGLILKWNGTSWQQEANVEYVYGAHLNAVSASSSADAWAVGNALGQSLIMRWVPSTNEWVRTPSPNLGTDQHLYGVVTLSSTVAYAVGDYRDASSNILMLSMRWNGSSWQTVPNSSNGGLLGIAGLGSEVWAAGMDAPTNVWQPAGEHWNGTGFTRTCTPGRTPYYSALRGAAITTSDTTDQKTVWFVGETNNDYNGSSISTLIERYKIPSP